jgi:hypothetical protein
MPAPLPLPLLSFALSFRQWLVACSLSSGAVQKEAGKQKMLVAA